MWTVTSCTAWFRNLPLPRKTAFVLGFVLLAGLTIFVLSLVSEYLVAPPWLEPFVHLLSRFAFMARLPMILLAGSVIPFEGHHVTKPIGYYLVTCFGAPAFWALLLVPVLAARRLGRRLSRNRSKSLTPRQTMTRRAFLGTGFGAPALLAGYAVQVEPCRLRVARYRMPIRDLPRALDGFRLVQVSDTHYGPFISLPYLRGAIEQANALHGDLVILTGDYVHHTPDAIGPGVDVLKRLRGRLGVLATLGNHDHWEGAESVRAAFAETGIPLIDNRRKFATTTGITNEPVAGESFCLGGVGDLWEDRIDFESATKDTPAQMPRIILAHNPDTAEQVPPALRVDLLCSGHTHGGQVWVPGFGTPILPSAYGQKYAGGLCHGPQCPVIVSRGVGMAVMPVRFGVPPEIVEITLLRL